MRYYFGLGVGHKYTHFQNPPDPCPIDKQQEQENCASFTLPGPENTPTDPTGAYSAKSDSQESDSGSSLDDDIDGSEDEEDEEDDWSDDDKFAAMHDMYDT